MLSRRLEKHSLSPPPLPHAQDYHPPDHSSFVTVWKKQEASAGNADAAEKLEPFDVVARSYGQQKLWPPHCVQGTPGCKFAEGLHIPADAIIVQKGHREQVDSYRCVRARERGGGVLFARKVFSPGRRLADGGPPMRRPTA